MTRDPDLSKFFSFKDTNGLFSIELFLNRVGLDIRQKIQDFCRNFTNEYRNGNEAIIDERIYHQLRRLYLALVQQYCIQNMEMSTEEEKVLALNYLNETVRFVCDNKRLKVFTISDNRLQLNTELKTKVEERLFRELTDAIYDFYCMGLKHYTKRQSSTIAGQIASSIEANNSEYGDLKNLIDLYLAISLKRNNGSNHCTG